jgi:hypothetical protein
MMSPDDDDIRVAGCRRIQTTVSLSSTAQKKVKKDCQISAKLCARILCTVQSLFSGRVEKGKFGCT